MLSLKEVKETGFAHSGADYFRVLLERQDDGQYDCVYLHKCQLGKRCSNSEHYLVCPPKPDTQLPDLKLQKGWKEALSVEATTRNISLAKEDT